MPANHHPDTPDLRRLHLQHDLNTPLTVIHARVQLLLRRLAASHSLPQRDREYLVDGLTSILQASGQMGTVIAEWSQSGRPQPGTSRALDHARPDHRPQRGT